MSKKWFRKCIKRGVQGFLIASLCLIIYKVSTTKSTPSSGLPDNYDSIAMYDDMEFYNLTHNEDGTFNDYGKSLL